MNPRREEKTTSLLKELFSEFFMRVNFNGALVTPTLVYLSKNLKSVKIFISIFPEEKERAALKILKSKAVELRKYVNEKIKMKYLPYFEFEIDKGEKNRQRIEEILQYKS